MKKSILPIPRPWLRLLSAVTVLAILVQISAPAIAAADDGSRGRGRGAAFGTSIGDSLGKELGNLGDSRGRASENDAEERRDRRSGDEGSSNEKDERPDKARGRQGDEKGVVIRDKFKDEAGADLSNHAPDVDEVGGGWVEGLFSDFQIIDGRGDGVMEVTELGGARVATVDTLLTEYEVSVEVTRDIRARDTGIVLRFIDERNYFAIMYDGFWLKLVKVVNGVEEQLERRPVPLWRNGETGVISTVLQADQFTVFLDGSQRLSANDSDLSGATRAGLFYRSNVESRFEDLRVNALAAAPGPAPVPTPNPEVIWDGFGSPDGTSLDAHTPDLVPFTGWEEITGDWTINGGTAVLASAEGDGDQFAFIPTGVADQTISVDMTYGGGLAGIAWGRDDASNLQFVFFDGSQLVLARVQNGNFIEHGRKALDWVSGETRNVTVRINGTSVRVYLDGGDIIMLRGIEMEQGAAQNAGLFTRFTTASRFDDFVVRPSLPLSEPDPVPPTSAPYVPSPGTVPSDAWFFDSFNAHNLSWLQFRDPELDPSADGWAVAGGKWFTWDGGASENSRSYDPLTIDRHAMIDTGRDEYEMTVDVTWNGDRIGVLFGGLASSTEDVGQNQYGVWKNGDGGMILYRWVGGVPYTVAGEWVDAQEVNWHEGQTKKITVRVEDSRARISVGGQEIFDFVDHGLEFGTWVGLFQRGKNDERYDNFKVSLLPGQEPPDNPPAIEPIASQVVTESDLLGVPVLATDGDGDPILLSLGTGAPSFASMADNGDGTGSVVLAPPVGDAGHYTIEVIATTAEASVSTSFDVNVEELTLPVSLVIDTFTDVDGLAAETHQPDVAPIGSSWVDASQFGGWLVSGNRVHEESLIDWADHRLVIDTTQANGRTSADIEYHGGLAGLAVRYIDESQMVLAWVGTGALGPEVVLGYIVPGNFIELGRTSLADAGISLVAGETRNFAVVTNGELVSVEIDGVEVLSGAAAIYLTATKSGLFTKSGVANYFDNFNYTIEVAASNQPPVFAPVPVLDVEVDEGGTLTLNVAATDPDGDAITLQPGADFPSFATLHDNGDGTGLVHVTPGFGDAGTYPVEIVASTAPGTATLTLELTVHPIAVNQAPWLDPISDQAVDEGQTQTVHISANDPESDPITLTLEPGAPSFVTLADNGDGAGLLVLAPTFSDSGVYSISISATAVGGIDTETFDLIINDTDRLPVVDPVADLSMTEGATLEIAIAASDPDGEPVAISLGLGVPAFVSIVDHGAGAATVTANPGAGDAGAYAVEVKASNAGGSGSASFLLTVNAVDNEPTIEAIADQALNEDEVLSVPVSASDVDADPIVLGLGAGIPGFVNLADNGDGTGHLALSPAPGDAGSYLVEVTATANGVTVFTTFTVLVSAPPSGLTALSDSFTDSDGVKVPQHAPDVAPGGANWNNVGVWGDWEIQGGRITEVSHIDWADHRLVVDDGESDGSVSVDIEYNGGSVGLVLRYVDELNWVMAWYVNNGGTPQVLIGSQESGNFTEIARIIIADLGLDWVDGETHNLGAELSGDSIVVTVDGTEVISEIVAVHQSATVSGVFSRSASANFLDNYEVLAP